jgi:hypothetical protein
MQGFGNTPGAASNFDAGPSSNAPAGGGNKWKDIDSFYADDEDKAVQRGDHGEEQDEESGDEDEDSEEEEDEDEDEDEGESGSEEEEETQPLSHLAR